MKGAIKGNGRPWQSILALAAVVQAGGGCASSQYAPQVVARGEITIQYRGGFELSAGGQPIAHSLLYTGLEHYVRCVPKAREHAQKATQNGRLGMAFSVLGPTLGAGEFLALIGLADRQHWPLWLASGTVMATAGLTLSILSRRYRNHAHGHAIDAVNYYNDSVGSLGASCDDLRYPQPSALEPNATPQPGPL